MTEDKVFVDTNVLVYAYDRSAGEKHKKARTILEQQWVTNLGMISTQVLHEFFVTVTRKIPSPITIDDAEDIITDFLTWKLITIDGESIRSAIQHHKKLQYSFWDSLIIEAALTGGASILLSEDFAGGHKINSLTIENPFVE